GGGALADVRSLDLSGLHPAVAEASIVVACDVDNPLTGSTGAARVYGPQKGADTADVVLLDEALGRWADVVARTTDADRRDVPGGGAAGGVGFAAVAVLDAELRPGIELMLDLLRFDEVVAGGDLVVTGEGSLDAQSLHGKAPVGVAARARQRGIPVVAVCGRRLLTDEQLQGAGIGGAYALLDLEPDVEVCLRSPGPLLARLGEQIAYDRLV
ncbi:glycerate kinase, partial [Nocardioides sp.]